GTDVMPRNWSPARARSRSIVSAALLPLCLFFATGAFLEHTRAADIRKGPDWVRVTEKAPWQPRDSQAEYVHDGHLWILGGWISGQKPNLLDVWKSSDGRNWTRTLEAGPWVQTDLPVSLVFQNRMWLMGGRKVPGTESSNKVWSSPDGVEWTVVTASAGWSARLAPGFAVFRDRMWVLGGTEDFYQNNDTTLLNDVWSSADGRGWRRENRLCRLVEASEWNRNHLRQQTVGPGGRRPQPAGHSHQRRLEFGRWRELEAGHRLGSLEAQAVVLRGRLPGSPVGPRRLVRDRQLERCLVYEGRAQLDRAQVERHLDQAPRAFRVRVSGQDLGGRRRC